MKAHVLRVWEELIGKLLDIAEREDDVAVNVSGCNYILPSFPRELLSKLGIRSVTVGILRTENGYAIRIIKETPSTCAFSAASTSPKEKHTESSVETIRAVGPDLKQFLKQTRSEEIETKPVINERFA